VLNVCCATKRLYWRPFGCLVQVSRGDLVTIVLTVPEAVFSARGDGVRRMVWLGSVQHASFLLDVLPSAPSGRHACSASVVCGVHALCMQFSIAVSDTRDVGRAAAVAAASAARHGASFSLWQSCAPVPNRVASVAATSAAYVLLHAVVAVTALLQL
jgi:hypothetical protein